MMLQHPKTTLFPYTTLFRSSTTDQSRREEHHQRDLENFQEISFLAVLMSCVLSNAKRQRREPATDEVRFGSERNGWLRFAGDRKSTRLNSSHLGISYAVFCL